MSTQKLEESISEYGRYKFQLIGFLLLFLLLVPIATYKSETSAMTDPYWRYQGQMWTSAIIQTGSIPHEPFSTNSYMSDWANTFRDDFGGPLFVAIISKLTGIRPLTLNNSPLFTLPFVLSAGIIARRLKPKPSVFPIAILFAVSYNFYIPHLTNTAHRGAMGWAIFFTMLAVFTVLVHDRTIRSSLLFLSLAITLPMSVHTLPIALILFWIVTAVGLFVTSNRTYFTLFVIIFVILSYNSIFSNWLGRVVLKFIVAFQVLASSSVESILSSLGSSQSIARVLLLYKHSFAAPTIYRVSMIIASLVSVSLMSIIVIKRMKKYLISGCIDDISLTDILLLAVCIQGVADSILIFLFAPSGGIDPFLLGLRFTPVFGSILVVQAINRWFASTLFQSAPFARLAIVTILLIALFAPAMGAYTYRPNLPGQQLFATDSTDTATLEWGIEYIHNKRIFSDFNTLSQYYALGGREATYIPPPGAPAYSSPDKASSLIKYYYKNPPSVHIHADVYLISDQMIDYGLFHQASIITRPAQDLKTSLNTAKGWQKVYTAGTSGYYIYGR